MTKPLVHLESTGIAPLDTILGGGLPSQSVTLIAGEPGSGKTVLTLQMLFHAARQGKKCLYFTALSEPAIKVIRYMQAFEFFDESLLDSHIRFIDLSAHIPKGADALIGEVMARVEEHEPAFVAIDSFRSLGDLLRTVSTARPFVFDLATQMSTWGATTLLVGEYVRQEYSEFAEFAVADGIIQLGTERQGLTSLREIEVLKLRGAGYSSGCHFLHIAASGVRVYPRVRAPVPSGKTPPFSERVATGVVGLDELLDGGLPCASSTVVQGGTGTGKTLLALSFLMEGIRLGEKAVLFTLEETDDQLRQIAKGFGWDLAALEARGLLVINYTSPVELSTDRYLNDALEQVASLGAKRAVLDGLTTMSLGVESERRFKELVYSLAKHMRKLGISLFMTMESDQLLGSANLSGLGISFVADNLIQLRYVEMEGRLERAISVIKARGVKLNTELRAASIGDHGMTVSTGRFNDLRGVLTGMPSRDKRD